MKTLLASVAAISLLASASFAGSLVEPEMEPMVEAMEDDDDSAGLLLPLLALAAIAAIAASGSNSGT